MKTQFISSESNIKVGNKVMFTEQFRGRETIVESDIWEVASVRKDGYGRMYIGIYRSTGIVEYSSTNFEQIISEEQTYYYQAYTNPLETKNN